MEWRPYFEAVEAIMNDFGGRPHWGKRHFQTAETLAPRYPRWAEFQAARDELDPGRAFTNEYAAARPRPLNPLEEGLAVAAVGGDVVDDLAALDQVQGVEALAELAGLGVAHVDAVADPQLVGGARRAAASAPRRRPPRRRAAGPGAARGPAAAPALPAPEAR